MNSLDMLNNCNLCYRQCNVNRNNNILGYCKAGKNLKVARAALHLWEEPCVSGESGSGTVFFSHCNFSCVFCQNHQISQEHLGKEITIERLSEIFLELQVQNANNINLVTPTHYIPQIIEAIKISKNKGLSIPILYNTNGYDTLDSIKALRGFIDVYLPDFKYYDDKYAIKYSNVKNYRENLMPILMEMYDQVGDAKFDKNGIIQKGMIIRHLMLPSLLFDSKKVIDTIHETFNNKVYISIMNQYTPMNKSYNFPEINKPLNPKHYDSLVDYALSIGVTKGFIQEEGSSSKAFVPSFLNEGV
ncbi:radical SAM protein [Clostridium paridis]|uniref:Radical SAM protein n=1 Tax=Clostridium paridis TaxID=2803863 RepID=A0A937FGA7_9CLOT|nr:radical SAM protein [Clostridium paridis]MBL4931402.1 radical SAM protein [Clostridium paridis]